MNRLVIFLLLFFAFISCDGRDRATKTNQEILNETKLLDSFSENIQYFPKEYSEKVTDTILSNDYNIRIKLVSDMTNSVLNSFQIDSIKYKHHYRDFSTEIIVKKKGRSIFNKNFKKSDFALRDTLNANFLNNESVMCFSRLDQEVSLKTNKPTIIVDFCKPETDHCLAYLVIINPDGTHRIEPTNNVYYHEQ